MFECLCDKVYACGFLLGLLISETEWDEHKNVSEKKETDQ